MKSYFDIKNTPLKFHRVYAAVVLPLDLFLNLYSLIILVSSITKNGAQVWDWISLGMVVLYLVLIMASFRGLLLFKKRGLYALYGLLLLQVVDNAYTLYLSYKSNDFVFVLSSLLSILILSSIFLYYFIRRSLFTKDGVDVALYMAKKKAMAEKKTEVYVPPEEERSEETEEIMEYDCPRCGHHITDGKVFCPKCGAQTRVVRK